MGEGSGAGEIRVTAGGLELGGTLNVPPGARGVVVFAHGTGSSRFSPRNRAVAETLQKAGLGTLLLDLLTREEEQEEAVTRHHRFNIGMLAERLLLAFEWLRSHPEHHALTIGAFGASTGAAAALIAAARRPQDVKAVVSRGGRADLAGDFLGQVQAPTLLIVGGADTPVIQFNEEALARMRFPKELVIVPRASHLFEEPGALDEVCRLACGWFTRHLAPAYAGRTEGA